MKKTLATVVALTLALAALLPGIATAAIRVNHNQTRLRTVAALAVALAALLPGIATAGIQTNHNQTRLRG